jgi:GT2 family glycosyltransferase
MINNSIPVIGTAIVNGVHWMKRLIESVDYPTDNFVIFDNNGRGQIAEELDEMVKLSHPFIKKITVTHMPANIGCSGAWNLIIKCFMNAPYWIIVNHDIAFSTGFLEKMLDEARDPEVGIVHGNTGDFEGVGSFDLYLMKDWVVRKYGLFDENLYPAYGEDADYIMRMRHDPIKRVFGIGMQYLHGDGYNYYETGQQTKRSEEGLWEKLNYVNDVNFEYLTKKWGIGWRNMWPYTHPFDNESMPLSTTSYDIDYVRRKYLGF